MGLLPSQILFFMIIFINGCFCLSRAADCGGNHIDKTFKVEKRPGKGHFTSVGDAISHINTPNNKWIMIYINSGIYRENITLPRDMSCIILKGAGRETTTIIYGLPQIPPEWNPTFSSSSSNVIVSGINFVNSYNLENLRNPIKQAVAAAFYGDKTAIFNCNFKGYQDTLFASNGRHYFKDCYIEGAVDFIFGEGQSYFENCMINGTRSDSKTPAVVTAQRRNSPNDPNGFVFKYGSVTGADSVILGRPWGPYPRVIFWETYFQPQVNPQGWSSETTPTNQLTYAEVKCNGPGANNNARVPWVKHDLSNAEKEEYSLSSFVNKDGWLNNLPSF